MNEIQTNCNDFIAASVCKGGSALESEAARAAELSYLCCASWEAACLWLVSSPLAL